MEREESRAKRCIKLIKYPFKIRKSREKSAIKGQRSSWFLISSKRRRRRKF